MTRRICFIYPQPWFAITPMLLSMLRLFDREGWKVDVICGEDQSNDIHMPGLSDSVSIYTIRGYDGKNPFKLMHTFFASFPVIWGVVSRKRHDYIIGVDPAGLIMAALIGWLLHIRSMYCSLELYFAGELKKLVHRMCKYAEVFCNRLALFTITQDSWRAEALARENRIPLRRMLIFPNTSPGVAQMEDSDLLRSGFGIAQDTKIILYPCSPFASAQIEALGRIAGSMPDGYILIIHFGWHPPNGRHLERGWQSCNRIIYSYEQFPYAQVHALYASADIGLALYLNSDRPGGGKNQDIMGYASGKFNLFVKCGKPVITTDQATFKAIFSQYRCGIAIHGFDEIPRAINAISGEMSQYRAEAIRFYNEKLCVEPYFKGMLDRLAAARDHKE